MVIQIPERLSPLPALNFSKSLASLHREKEFIYDFTNMQHCPPFGMLIVADAIRTVQESFPQCKHIPINYDRTQGCQFASNFGFSKCADGILVCIIQQNPMVQHIFL